MEKDYDLSNFDKVEMPKNFILFNPKDSKDFSNFLKDKDKVLLDTIAIGCAMPTHKVAQLLLKLEMKSLVRPLPGKLFQWI